MAEQHPLLSSKDVKATPITRETKEWLPGLKTVMPIRGEDIPGFVGWVNIWPFNNLPDDVDGRKRLGHLGHDFAAYVRKNTKGGVEIVIGLPPGTPVRAVADGEIVRTDKSDYFESITVAHAPEPEFPSNVLNQQGLVSKYVHVTPTPEVRSALADRKKISVNAGDIIGSLYIDDPKRTELRRLVHLHQELLNPASGYGLQYHRWINPAKILGLAALTSNTADQLGSLEFSVPGLPPDTKIVIANWGSPEKLDIKFSLES